MQTVPTSSNDQHLARDTLTDKGRAVHPDLQAIFVLWRRELIRTARLRGQLFLIVANPVLFVVLLGTGLSMMTGNSAGIMFYLTYLFPGILVFAVLPWGISSGLSITRDREAGFLRGMLVAPVRRSTLLIGKCLGGATAAAAQGGLLLVFAGFVGISYHPGVLAAMFLVLVVSSLCMTSLGALGAVTMKRSENFQAVVGMALFPMFMFSGAMFPLNALPAWFLPLVLANPLTYAVDAMRWAASLGTQRDRLAQVGVADGVEWFGWNPPVGVGLAAMCLLSLAILAVAARRFGRGDIS